jgi:Zn-dependent protease
LKSRLEIIEVGGIPIRIHLSWLLVFGLVTWSLAAGYFPGEYPGWTAGSYWAIGAVSAFWREHHGFAKGHRDLARAWVGRPWTCRWDPGAPRGRITFIG